MSMCINFTKHGKCSQCGECCTDFLYMTKEEIERIHDYIKENNLILRKWAPLPGVPVKQTCVFLVNHKCSIYSVRPSICKKFICSLTDGKILRNRNRFAKPPYILVETNKEFSGGYSVLDSIKDALRGGAHVGSEWKN